MNATLTEATGIAFEALNRAVAHAIRNGMIPAPQNAEDAQGLFNALMGMAVTSHPELQEMFTRGMAEHVYDMMQGA